MSRLLAGIAIAGTFLLGAVLFVLVWTGGLPQWLDTWLRDYFLLALAVLVAALIAIGAYLMRVARFYAYAVLMFAAFALGQWLNTSAGLPVTVAAGAILLCGLVVLMRFLRKYPLPKEEQPDDNR